jgi:hypothetical protein
MKVGDKVKFRHDTTHWGLILEIDGSDVKVAVFEQDGTPYCDETGHQQTPWYLRAMMHTNTENGK